MSERPLIQVILGSTRPGRFSEKAGAWVVDRLGSRDDLEVELLDLRDFPMPLYENERPPVYRHCEYAADVEPWAQAAERGDGYIVVSPEYNHGYAAVLKNAFEKCLPGVQPHADHLGRLRQQRRCKSDRAAGAPFQVSREPVFKSQQGLAIWPAEGQPVFGLVGPGPGMKYAKYDRHEYMHVDNSVYKLRIHKCRSGRVEGPCV